LFIHITLETAPNEMQCDETNSHMVTAGRLYFDLISGYSRQILGQSYFDLISGYSRPILDQSYFDLISGYSRPIIFRSYFGLQQADLRLIICRSYFGWQQGALISALGETCAWLQAKPPWLQAK